MADAVLRVRADTTQAQRALGTLNTALASLVTVATAQALIRVADSATNLSNRLRQVSETTAHTNLLFNELVQVANNARTPLATTGDLFFRIARSADSLGISQRQALTVTELVSKGISAAGMSAAEASGPLLQFGQALQSGRFQGDELRSILEGLPVVSRALATSLGVPIGALKKLGSEGKISAKQVVDALLQAKGVIEKDFAKTLPTIGQAFTVLQNNFTAFIAKLDSSLGLSKNSAGALVTLAAAVQSLSNNIATVIDFFKILGQIAITVFLYTFAGRIAVALRSFAGTIQSIGFFIKDFSKNIAAMTGGFAAFYAVAKQQVLSIISQIRGRGQALTNVFDFLFRAVFIPLNGVIRILASLFQNLHLIIGVAIGTVLGFLDPVIQRLSILYDKTMQLLGLSNAPATGSGGGRGPAVGEVEAFNELNKAKKASAVIDDKYVDFLKDLRASLSTRAAEIALLNRKGQLSEDQFAQESELLALTARAQAAGFNNKEVQLLNQKLALLAAEESQLNRLFKENEKLLETGRDLVIETARGSDARIAIDEDYYKKLFLLGDYYLTGKLVSEEQYQRTKAALEQQYNIDSISAEMQNTEKMYADKFALDNRALNISSQHFNLQLEQEKKLSALVFENFNRELILQTELFAVQQNSVTRRMEMQFTAANQEILLRTQIYDLEVSQQEKLAALRQSMFQKELQQRGFSLEQSKSMATERTNFDKKTEREKTQFAIEQGASVFASLGQHNRTAFQAAKAFNIASAIMNTYTGATKALATYPPPFNFIAAAGVVAMGLAQVATIRSQNYAGRALGGPMVGGQQYIVGERGPELVTAPSGGARVIANSDLGSNTTIVFQIQANDTRGFDQLLAERKGMIINMIRQAQQDRGRVATV